MADVGTELALDLTALSAQAKKILGPQAPAPIRAMAAKGIVPGIKPGELVTVLVALSQDPDQALASSANQTLDKLPPPVLDGALGTSDLQPAVVLTLAGRLSAQTHAVERLLRMSGIPEAALVLLAERANEAVGELVATNEALLLRFPSAIEALYMNKRVRMSTADRLIDLAVRNQLELSIPAYKLAAQAIQNELIPEPTDEPSFDDILFQETEGIAKSAELSIEEEHDTHERDDEGEEQLKTKFLPLHAQIAQMTITQKIRRATLGTSAERLLLVRESNRLIASAAASSPMLTESDAARIASSRNVMDEVLRIIAQNRAFTRSYQVKLNLITNPKTPFTFSSRMIPHLRDNDLRSIAKSKAVPANIQLCCRQQLLRKQNKKP